MADAVSTKQALAKGLKATLEHKSLDRVTVGDITTFCGLNRQTFYYHFEDKYALLNWIYYTELMLPLAEGSAPEDWPRRVARMLDRMREEGAFYRRALRGEGQRGFEALLTAMVGLFRFDFTLNRLHAASIADTLGLSLLVLAVMLAVGLRPVLWKLLLMVILQWCTSPLSGHMLAQFEYRVNQNLEQHLELPAGEQEDRA